MKDTFDRIYIYRFEVFFIIQLLILFGSIIVPQTIHEETLLPLLFLLNIGIGIILLHKSKRLMWFCILLFLVSVIYFGKAMLSRQEDDGILIRLLIYSIFYLIVTWNIIREIWSMKSVDRNVIFGLMSGYISLGFLAFFLFMAIELLHPGSFVGKVLESEEFALRVDGIMYYAYITLMTIGYGEIIPATTVAQKAAVLVGLAGQFYLVIITAVVIEKYMYSRHQNEGDV